MPTPDTNLYLQQGETPEAYNTRTEAYFASKRTPTTDGVVSPATQTNAPAPAPVQKPISGASSSAIPAMTKGITTAVEGAKSALSSTPAEAPKTPAPLPTGYSTGNIDANGNATIIGANGKAVMTVPAGSDPTNTIKAISNVQSAVSKQFGSNYAVTSDNSGNLSIADETGKVITSIGKDAVSDPGSIASAVGAIQIFQDTKASNEVSVNAQKAQLEQQLKNKLAEIATEKDAAMAAGGANAGGAMLAGSTGGQVNSAITERFDRMQQAAQDAFNSAMATVNANAQEANTKAEADMQSALQGIQTQAKTDTLNTDKFQQQIKQQNLSDFMNYAKTFDVTIPPGTTVRADGTTGIAAIDDGIKMGIAGGKTAQEAFAELQQGSIASNKAGMADLSTQLASFELTGVEGMTAEQAENDKGNIGLAFKKAMDTLGADATPERALSLLQGSFKNKKAQEDLTKEQTEIQRASVNSAVALANLQIKEGTASQRQSAIINKTLTAKNTPLGNLVNALSFKSIADESYETIRIGNLPNATADQKASARAASSKLLATDSRAFTGGVARSGNIDLEKSAQSISDKIDNAKEMFSGGSHIISSDYAKGLKDAMDSYVSGLSKDTGVKTQYGTLVKSRDTLIERTPEYEDDIRQNSSLLDVIEPVMNNTSGTGGITTAQSILDKYKIK